MNYVWGLNRAEKNSRLVFAIEPKEACDVLRIVAADFYQVFADGQLVSYGPQRTAAGYAYARSINIANIKTIEIKVIAYNVPTYACDLQLPYFGAELLYKGKAIYATEDFECFTEYSRTVEMPRYSCQRGFVEGYDFTRAGKIKVETVSVPPPVEEDENVGDVASYAEIPFEKTCCKPFDGFSSVKSPLWWERQKDKYFAFENAPDIPELFENAAKESFTEYEYVSDKIHAGFIALDVVAEEEITVLAAFEEYLPDGKWFFRRSSCNDCIILKFPAGKHKFVSFEPYSLMHLMLCVKGKCEIIPKIILLENGKANCVNLSGNAEIESIFYAARQSFACNAVDIFTDCPGRERAGWLCDSYFTAKAERLFTGNNIMERAFLLNFLRAETPEIPKDMLPKCFPTEHADGRYIPNWAMWFVLELHDYFLRTGDETLATLAKSKVYGIIEFFNRYENEYGLLENLESWVFLEWSVCNSDDYIKGVNFPSNMLYAQMLQKAGELYKDNSLCTRAEKIKREVVKRSYNGIFFVDNAVRENGELVRRDDHISETCQYYALFTGICPDNAFKKKVFDVLGPSRKENELPEIGKSNMFIGYYLRLFALVGEKEYDRAISECITCFSDMAKKTGTLWENNLPTASCNHGFASVAAVILLRCMFGYIGVKDGNTVFADCSEKDYGVNIEFDYKKL